MARWFNGALIDGEITKSDVFDAIESNIVSSLKDLDITVKNTVIHVIPYSERSTLRDTLLTALAEVKALRRYHQREVQK